MVTKLPPLTAKNDKVDENTVSRARLLGWAVSEINFPN